MDSQPQKTLWPLPKMGPTGKVIGIGFLVLLLQIPLQFVNYLRFEREGMRNKALAEVGNMWGGEQQIIGPILVVPYHYKVETMINADGHDTGKRTTQSFRANAYFLPAKVSAEGKLEPEVRTRGIYPVTVYSAHLRMEGCFDKSDWEFLSRQPSVVLWSEARVIVAVSDVRGIREIQALELNGSSVNWKPGTRWNEWRTGLEAPVMDLNSDTRSLPFVIKLTLKGSKQFGIIPAGKTFTVKLASPWPDPSFSGAYLPNTRTVGDGGFEAVWQVTHLGRPLPQQWSDATGEAGQGKNEIQASALGVNLVKAVDSYRTTERAIKHGLLFVSLVLIAFFVFEFSGKQKLNVLHYLLVGAALCLFYLCLLSLSEFLGFAGAYAVAAISCTALITVYSYSVLRSGMRASLVFGMLTAVYGYLYFVLHMQDYALLAGSVALFAALAAVMWVTRRWEQDLEA